MNKGAGIFTNEEKSLFSLMENYRNEINVSQINVSMDHWKTLRDMYNSHVDIIPRTKTKKQVRRIWLHMIPKYLQDKEATIFTDEEKLVWSIVENYRNNIDVSHFKLNNEDWKKVLHIYNSNPDMIGYKKTSNQLERMWTSMLNRRLKLNKFNKRLSGGVQRAGSMPSDEESDQPAIQSEIGVDSQMSNTAESGQFGQTSNSTLNKLEKNETVSELDKNLPSTSLKGPHRTIDGHYKKMTSRQKKIIKFRLKKANYRKAEMEAQIAELQLKLDVQEQLNKNKSK